MRRRGESGLAAEKLTNDVKLRPRSVEKELVESWEKRGLEEDSRNGGRVMERWRESDGEVEGVRLR